MSAFARSLLAWFDRHARDLPWRRQRSPYSVLVSEMMLQQTTVAAVIPFHQRFLARFPDWNALAGAPLEDVLAAWAGLGYYRRARSLHATARAIVERGGEFPASREEALALPGLGPYTAGAVLSLAFGLPEPAVDGNVARVLSRWTGEPLMAARAADRRRLEAIVLGLQSASRPGAFNEALMELGATVCLPRAPRCEACPVRRACRARMEGRVAELPPLAPRASPKQVRAVAALVERAGRVLVVRRAESEAILPGLWELPGAWLEAPRSRDGAGGRSSSKAGPADPLQALLRDTLRSLGGGQSLERLGSITHVITHRRLSVDLHRCKLDHPPRASEGLAWIAPGDTARPLTTATRKALALLAREATAAGPGAPRRTRGRAPRARRT